MRHHHRDPHRIYDDSNLFEVTANSSHPDLKDSVRIYHFKGRTFQTPEALERFFDSEGLDPKQYWFRASKEPDGFKGQNLYRIWICERVPNSERQQALTYEQLHGRRG